MEKRKTKIVCTLGPSSDSLEEIVRLIIAGMDVARLNFSHGSYEHHQTIINNLRKAEEFTGKRIALLQDLQGPKIRLGDLPKDGIKVNQNELITLTPDKVTSLELRKKIIPIQYKRITKEVKKGDQIFIDDGLIELKVTEIKHGNLVCEVVNDGILKSRKGVNLPHSKLSIPTITEKDLRDLEFGLKNNVDFVALSFVRNQKDIDGLRKIIRKSGKDVAIVAKIETNEAVNKLRSIIKATDAVMVARGDLGIEIPAEKVPIVQKEIIHLAKEYGRPVITATQVLQSMIKNSRATRAEISDAANAVYDGTDAIMLSNESAIGRYPSHAVETLHRVSLAVEKAIAKHREIMENLHTKNIFQISNATYLNACELAIDMNADYLVNYSESGFSARQIAKNRPSTPIITLTPSEKVARKLTLVWGLNCVMVTDLSNQENKTTEIIRCLKNKKLVKKNQKVLIVYHNDNRSSLITSFNI